MKFLNEKIILAFRHDLVDKYGSPLLLHNLRQALTVNMFIKMSFIWLLHLD